MKRATIFSFLFQRGTLRVILLLLACACASAPSSAPLPSLANRTVVVLPANNRTGDDLLVTGASFLEKYAWPGDRLTVADVLTAEAHQNLAQRGFNVVAAADVPNDIPTDRQSAARLASLNRRADLALYIEIRRWEPDAWSHPSFVIAAVDVALVDAQTAEVLWTASHPTGPIATPGVVNAGDAFAIAAHTVIKQLLGALTA